MALTAIVLFAVVLTAQLGVTAAVGSPKYGAPGAAVVIAKQRAVMRLLFTRSTMS